MVDEDFLEWLSLFLMILRKGIKLKSRSTYKTLYLEKVLVLYMYFVIVHWLWQKIIDITVNYL